MAQKKSSGVLHIAVPAEETTDQAPPQNIARMTPRTVKRTLYMIRVAGAERSPEYMRDLLAVSEERFKEFEGIAVTKKPELGIEIAISDLLRYQDAYGIPTGIILLMSQILAAARDDRPDHLEVIAKMAEALAGRINDPPKRQQAIEDVRGDLAKTDKVPQLAYEFWDNYLFTLLGSVMASVPRAVRLSMTNSDRLILQRQRLKKRQENIVPVQKARNRKRAATSGAAPEPAQVSPPPANGQRRNGGGSASKRR